MADKQVTRPTGLVPSWSNDQSMNDPSEAWHGDDTKTEPGAGKRDDGWLPDEDIETQHVNHLMWEDKAWIQFFSDIQIQNWPLPTTLPLVSGDPNTGNAIVWDYGSQQWWVVGDDVSLDMISSRSTDGYIWFPEKETTGTFNDPANGFAYSKPDNEAPTHSDSLLVTGCSGHILVNQAGSWTNYPINSENDAATCGAWDTVIELLLVGGYDTTGPFVPVFYYSDPATISWTRVVPSASNSDQVVDMAASGEELVLAIGRNANGDTWTSEDGIVWTLRTTTIDNMVACRYNPAEGLWMILTSGGEVHTSSDAINWSLKASTGLSFQTRCLRASGSVWVALDAAERTIYFSTDSGTTWRPIVVPMDHDANIDWVGIDYSEDQRKFMLVAYDATNGAHVNQSLSLGTVRRDSGGSVNNPTVT